MLAAGPASPVGGLSRRGDGPRPLPCTFHTRRSRRREEADGPSVGTSPPPHVGGYGLWAFHARYEISRLKRTRLHRFSDALGRSYAALCALTLREQARYH